MAAVAQLYHHFLSSSALWHSDLGVHLDCKLGSHSSQGNPWRTTGGETSCECSERKLNGM